MNAPAPDVLQEDLTLLVPPAPPAASGGGSVLVIAVALLFALAVVWFWWRQSRAKTARPGPAESPEEIALRALTDCETRSATGDRRAAVNILSQVLRQYVESRFGLRALTLTTEEFWAAQRAQRSIPEAPHTLLTDFTAACDEIKYAGRSASDAQWRELLQVARSFVEISRTAQRGDAAPP
jgi:hypothetical protein